jgi:hypothetical protein
VPRAPVSKIPGDRGGILEHDRAFAIVSGLGCVRWYGPLFLCDTLATAPRCMLLVIGQDIGHYVGRSQSFLGFGWWFVAPLPVHQYDTRRLVVAAAAAAAAAESWSGRRRRRLWRPSWPQRADTTDYGSPKSPNCSIYIRAVCPWVSIERGRDDSKWGQRFHGTTTATTTITTTNTNKNHSDWFHPLPQFLDNLGYLIFIFPSTSSGTSSSSSSSSSSGRRGCCYRPSSGDSHSRYDVPPEPHHWHDCRLRSGRRRPGPDSKHSVHDDSVQRTSTTITRLAMSLAETSSAGNAACPKPRRFDCGRLPSRRCRAATLLGLDQEQVPWSTGNQCYR